MRATEAVEFFNLLTSPELLGTTEALLPEYRERLYPPAVVRNLNRMQPGSPYRSEALYEYQLRLQQTGYFSNVEVIAEVPAADGVAPLVVRVSEAKPKKVEFSLVYSTNTGARTAP